MVIAGLESNQSQEVKDLNLSMRLKVEQFRRSLLKRLKKALRKHWITEFYWVIP